MNLQAVTVIFVLKVREHPEVISCHSAPSGFPGEDWKDAGPVNSPEVPWRHVAMQLNRLDTLSHRGGHAQQLLTIALVLLLRH